MFVYSNKTPLQKIATFASRRRQENKSSRHNSVTAAVSNGQTTSQALTEVENKSKQSPSPLHHTFLLGRARFTAQPLSALQVSVQTRL